MTRPEKLAALLQGMSEGSRRDIARVALRAFTSEEEAEWKRLVNAARQRRHYSEKPNATPKEVPLEKHEPNAAAQEISVRIPPSPSSSPAPSPTPPTPPTPTPASPYNPPPPAADGEGKGKPKKPVDEEPADPRFVTVTAGYCEAYEAAFGEPYAHNGGRDGTALKKLLKSLGDRDYFTADRIIGTAKKAMKRRLQPYAKECKFVSNLHSFCQHYNDIRTELISHEPATTEHTRAEAARTEKRNREFDEPSLPPKIIDVG